MILLIISAILVVIVSIVLWVEDDFGTGILALLAGCGFWMVIALIVVGISNATREENRIIEPTETYAIVDAGGYVRSKTEDGKDYYVISVKYDKGIQERSVLASRTYIVFDDDPHFEVNSCIAFRKFRLYFWASPGLIDDYYVIYVPEG